MEGTWEMSVQITRPPLEPWVLILTTMSAHVGRTLPFNVANFVRECNNLEEDSGKWTDVCGFLKPPDSDGPWTVRQHGAVSIPHEALGIRPTDQSCHHEAWLHLDIVDWRNEQPHHEKHDRRILLKERSAPYHHGKPKGHISDVMSDHSLSSLKATIRRQYV